MIEKKYYEYVRTKTLSEGQLIQNYEGKYIFELGMIKEHKIEYAGHDFVVIIPKIVTKGHMKRMVVPLNMFIMVEY